MIGRDQSDIYVAACGEPLPTRFEGLAHERSCPACQQAIRDEANEIEDRDAWEDAEDWRMKQAMNDGNFDDP